MSVVDEGASILVPTYRAGVVGRAFTVWQSGYRLRSEDGALDSPVALPEGFDRVLWDEKKERAVAIKELGFPEYRVSLFRLPSRKPVWTREVALGPRDPSGIRVKDHVRFTSFELAGEVLLLGHTEKRMAAMELSFGRVLWRRAGSMTLRQDLGAFFWMGDAGGGLWELARASTGLSVVGGERDGTLPPAVAVEGHRIYWSPVGSHLCSLKAPSAPAK